MIQKGRQDKVLQSGKSTLSNSERYYSRADGKE